MKNKNDKIDELIDFCLSRAEIDCFTDEQFKIRNQYYELCGFLRILKDGYIERVVRGQICELMTFNITCPYCGRKYSIEKLNAWPEDGRTSNENVGEWILSGNSEKYGGYCSKCHVDMPTYTEDWKLTYKATKYCPGCGARMKIRRRDIK